MMQSGYRDATMLLINLNENASVEKPVNKYAAIGSTMTKNSGDAYTGTYSLKTITNNAAAKEGWKRTVTDESEAEKEYTFSVYLKGSGTVILRFYDDVTGNQDGVVITLSTTYTRYSLTKTFGAGSTVRELQVVTDVKQSMTFYSDAMMHELGATLSAYTDNNLTEAIEIGPYELISFILPVLDDGDITFTVAEREDETYVGLKKLDGTDVKITAGAGNKAIRHIVELRGHRWMKVAHTKRQTAERKITVILKWPK